MLNEVEVWRVGCPHGNINIMLPKPVLYDFVSIHAHTVDSILTYPHVKEIEDYSTNP